MLAAYVTKAGAPGFPTQPGWWAWYDQSVTLRSARAFIHGDLRPGEHWYPLLYSLLGAPFLLLTADHAFLPVNLVCLTASAWAAVAMGRRMGLPWPCALAAVALGLVGDPVSLRNWAVPWNTAPVAALIWALLACCAAQIAGERRAFAIGLCGAAIAACRPTDALTVIPALLMTAWSSRRQPHRWPDLARCAAGALLVAAPAVTLHLAIYSAAPSPYMIVSREVGFTLTDFAWRAYVLLIDPTEWFQDGHGLIRHYLWLPLGFAGLLLAWRWGPASRLLALSVAANLALYLAYVDLVPIGLWRYLNVHYFAWAMPGWALLAACLLRALLRAPERRSAAIALTATLLLSGIHMPPIPAAPDQKAKAIDFAGPPPPFATTFHGSTMAVDDAGLLPTFTVARTFPIAAGLRLIGMRRWIEGPVRWPQGFPQGSDLAGSQTRYAIGLDWGWPRWAMRSGRRSVLP